MNKLSITLLAALLAASSALAQYKTNMRPTECKVGVEISYDGERHVTRTVSDFNNLFFSGFALFQDFKEDRDSCVWKIKIKNDTRNAEIEVGSLWFELTTPDQKEDAPARMGYQSHHCIAGNASYIYWCRYDGVDGGLLMTTADHTALEYVKAPNHFDIDRMQYYIHGKWATDPNDTWRMPLTSLTLAPGEEKAYTFRFERMGSHHDVAHRISELGGLTIRVAPGMVIPAGKEVLCAVDCPKGIKAIDSEFPGKTTLKHKESYNDNEKTLLSFTFKKKGENQVVIEYGDGDKAYLEFFVTEPIEQLIRKRSAFITKNQQIQDPSKWYDGLYSVWDMETCKLMTPDDYMRLPEYQVGGSDDPSNCKPLYISEKNVFWPDKNEVQALEYYEDHFVYGKLQRTGDEMPYPYGIYGSENWFQNRSGNYGSMDSGGWGLQRLWRTFDYVTHMAIYYNLYLIASANPSLTQHPASYWLDMAYHTTMAFFTVPYNIYMQKFAFTGWCDWAYKQGNFHERYILDIMDALEENELHEQAAEIRHEWEKKVLYFMYDDPWPFASEFDIDRTAYESTYYIADYGLRHQIEPRQNLWQDKNSGIWYSYDKYDCADAMPLLHNQLASNLAMRGIHGLKYWKVGSSREPGGSLDYMSQMGGAAILDYAFRYSDDPARYVNYGYNSICSSWALINSGYWSKEKANNGAAGWEFTEHQNRWFMTYEMISSKRGPFRIDGEIDHGFTGGVHAAGTYVVDDPDFGTYAYGGELQVKDDSYKVLPDDGVCRRVFFTTPCRVGIELRQDAFAKNTYITTNTDGSHISFTITNRYGTKHDSHVRLWTLEEGTYEVKVNDAASSVHSVSGVNRDLDLAIPLGKDDVHIMVTRVE